MRRVCAPPRRLRLVREDIGEAVVADRRAFRHSRLQRAVALLPGAVAYHLRELRPRTLLREDLRAAGTVWSDSRVTRPGLGTSIEYTAIWPASYA